MFIFNFSIFPLISTSDIFNINERTLMLKIISKCDVKHITMVSFKNNIGFAGLEYIVTGIAASPTGYTAIL